MGFLEDHADFEAHINMRGFTVDRWSKAERRQLALWLAAARAAGQIPRRLGGDATRDALAADKRCARRVAWALQESLIAWGGKPSDIEIDDAARRTGATLDWEELAADVMAWCNRRSGELAAACLRRGLRGYGNKAVYNYQRLAARTRLWLP